MKQISYDDYLKLRGLRVLAEEANKRLDDIRLAALAITEERDAEGAPQWSGHTGDWVYGEIGDTDMLLRRLGITVAPEPTREAGSTP